MAKLPFRIECDDGSYTSVLLNQYHNTGYFGTSRGCVEIWDLEMQNKITEVRYLILNHFNEPLTVNEPVVNLAAPNDFRFVYAFMGIAAYCIDTTLRQIIQQIPISERVVFGSVSPQKGEIGVLAETGYLSRWSPKFVERTGSIEFNRRISKAFVAHDYNESRIILVQPEGKVILTNLEGERYIEEFELSEAPQYIISNRYDRNAFQQVFIEPDGALAIYDSNTLIDWVNETVYRNGILSACEHLRKRVNDLEKQGVDRNYIPDVRFNRQSHDRYDAERDSIGKQLHHSTNEQDDSKTLNYALETYSSGDFPTKSEALAVIKRISERYGVDSKYVHLAWRNRPDPTKLVSISQNFQDLSLKRIKRINQLSLLYFPILFFTLLVGMSSLSREIVIMTLGTMFGVTFFLILYNNSINHNPRFPWIREYKALRMLVLIAPVFFVINRDNLFF